MEKRLPSTQGSILELRHFYDQEFKRTVIKDEDRAYHWMAHSLFKPFIMNKRVLDVGCGGGFFLKEARQFASYAVGMDLSGEALRIASQTNQNCLTQGSAEDLPFENESFNTIFCLGSLEHFSDIQKALKEMGRVCRKNGWVFAMVPNLFWYKDVISVLRSGDICDRNQRYEFFASPSQWAEVISSSGVKIKKTWKYNGISKSALKQRIKDLVIPKNLSYHIIFGCQP